VEGASAYPNRTVRENLNIQRRLTGVLAEAVTNVIAMLDLGQYENCRAGTLSLGNKQRLSLAQAMVHHPIC